MNRKNRLNERRRPTTATTAMESWWTRSWSWVLPQRLSRYSFVICRQYCRIPKIPHGGIKSFIDSSRGYAVCFKRRRTICGFWCLFTYTAMACSNFTESERLPRCSEMTASWWMHRHIPYNSAFCILQSKSPIMELNPVSSGFETEQKNNMIYFLQTTNAATKYTNSCAWDSFPVNSISSCWKMMSFSFMALGMKSTFVSESKR